MKSLIYSIPRVYMPTYKFTGEPPRIKVYHKYGRLMDIVVFGPYAPFILWTKVVGDIEQIIAKDWREACEIVDIMPGDRCAHSDEMIPE